jgi:hypothetical protein
VTVDKQAELQELLLEALQVAEELGPRYRGVVHHARYRHVIPPTEALGRRPRSLSVVNLPCSRTEHAKGIWHRS